MKIFQYVSVLLAVVARSAPFFSCDRDKDIEAPAVVDPNAEVNGKTTYWIDFTLSNPGSLSDAAQARFVELRDTTIYGDKGIKIIEHGMYNTYDYVKTNFDAVAALPNAENDIVQKVMLPTSLFDDAKNPKKDFAVTMTLSKDSMRTVLATKVWNAAEVLN